MPKQQPTCLQLEVSGQVTIHIKGREVFLDIKTIEGSGKTLRDRIANALDGASYRLVRFNAKTGRVVVCAPSYNSRSGGDNSADRFGSHQSWSW